MYTVCHPTSVGYCIRQIGPDLWQLVDFSAQEHHVGTMRCCRRRLAELTEGEPRPTELDDELHDIFATFADRNPSIFSVPGYRAYKLTMRDVVDLPALRLAGLRGGDWIFLSCRCLCEAVAA